MPTNPIDLTTLAAVRAEQQKPADNTDQDAIIATLITQASRSIMDHCSREFAPITTGAARVFELNRHDEGWLALTPYDLASLTSIQIDTDSPTPVTLTPAEYRLYPKNTPEATYRAIRLAPFLLVAPSIRFAFREVTVTGNWGFPTIPETVERACIVTVSEWLRERYLRDPGMSSEFAAAGIPEPARPSALPYNARSLLSEFKDYGSA